MQSVQVIVHCTLFCPRATDASVSLFCCFIVVVVTVTVVIIISVLCTLLVLCFVAVQYNPLNRIPLNCITRLFE